MSKCFRKNKISLNYKEANAFKAELFHGIRVLEVTDDFLIGAKGYKFYKYDLNNKTWKYFSKVADLKYSFLSKYGIIRRLLRVEVTNLYTFANGGMMCIAKKGIYKYDKDTRTFKKCFHVIRGSRPLTLCQDKNETIYFGEYFINIEKKPVNIYKSIDFGATWNIAYTFNEGSINHIHGIFYDKYTEKVWIVTGDREDECIIAYTEDGFKTINILFRGGQEYRSCQLLFYPDFIIYVTDSQYIQNQIKLIQRETKQITTLQGIQGSGIYAAQSGDIAMISTTVEPSKVNFDQNSYLWISRNGKVWKQIAYFEKDCFHPKFFQLGSIRFPQYNKKDSSLNRIYFTGRSLKKVDGNTIELDLENI